VGALSADLFGQLRREGIRHGHSAGVTVGRHRRPVQLIEGARAIATRHDAAVLETYAREQA